MVYQNKHEQICKKWHTLLCQIDGKGIFEYELFKNVFCETFDILQPLSGQPVVPKECMELFLLAAVFRYRILPDNGNIFFTRFRDRAMCEDAKCTIFARLGWCILFVEDAAASAVAPSPFCFGGNEHDQKRQA